MKPLVTKLASALRKTIGPDVDLIQGPFVAPALGGLRPTIFVAIRSFADDGRITADGARTARSPVPGDKPGYAEERPGRLEVSVDCVGLSYPAVAQYCEVVIPAALMALGAGSSVSFGALPDGSCSVEFTDFSVSLHTINFQVEPDKDRPFSRATIVFELDGFLRARILRNKVRVLPKRKKRARPKG